MNLWDRAREVFSSKKKISVSVELPNNFIKVNGRYTSIYELQVSIQDIVDYFHSFMPWIEFDIDEKISKNLDVVSMKTAIFNQFGIAITGLYLQTNYKDYYLDESEGEIEGIPIN